MVKEKTVLIIATLDSKGPEALFAKRTIEERGLRTLVLDIGITGKAPFSADIPSRQVADAASRTLAELLSFDDEAKAMAEMAKGAETFVHNEIASGIQATVEEMAETGRVIASRLNRSRGPVAAVIPERGFMEYDRPGGKIEYPEGRKAFIDALRDHLHPSMEFIRMDCHINDSAYSEKITDIALRLLKSDVL